MKTLKKALSLLLCLTMLAAMTVTGFTFGASAGYDAKELVVYFANWSVYSQGADAEVASLPWDKITYINHAFFAIVPDGEGNYPIESTDPWADFENTAASGVDESLPINNFAQYEHFSALYPDVNILISVGGWTKCGYFSEMASTAAGRASFINSCIDWMNKYEFIDGIDIDWEYPGVARDPESDSDQGCPASEDDYDNYTLLLKEMREAFDIEFGANAKKVTTCESVNFNVLTNQDCAEIHKYVDLINVMCYDMTGSYDSVTGHQSCIYNEDKDGYSVDSAIDYLLSKGVPASKINIGSPLYCHGWGSVEPDAEGNVLGVSGSSEGYNGDIKWYLIAKLQAKAVEDGTPGWHYYYDTDAKASYLYNDNPNSNYYKNFLTYDSIESVRAKADYINEKGLAGIILWEVNGDSVKDDYPFISQLSSDLGIYSGEIPSYTGEGVTDPEVIKTLDDPIYEVVAGDGSKIFPIGSQIYYNGALWQSTNDNSNDYADNLPDGKWGASCWKKLFDVKTYVSQEENGGAWAWETDGDEYFFYDPNKDGVGGIYYATAQTSNTANDAPDGIWGTNWQYMTTLWLDGAEEAMVNPIYEIVAGDGSESYPSGTIVYYNGAVWESTNDASNNYVDNLPDGKWGASCWSKLFDVKTYVSNAELGYWDYAAHTGEYVLYNPDGDNEADIYYATTDISNTENDAPDGIWGADVWKYKTTVVLYTEPSLFKDPINEVVAGDGFKAFKKGTQIYYNGAIWESINDAANDFAANLPDGQWGESCWKKICDVKKYVSNAELGYWDWAANEGEYVLYNPDGDTTAKVYYATTNISNTENDAPDGIWGADVWEYTTTVKLLYQPKFADGATIAELTSYDKYFGTFSTSPFTINDTEYVSYPAGAVVEYNGKYYENYVDGSSAWGDGWEPDVHSNWHEITTYVNQNRLYGRTRVATAIATATAIEKTCDTVVLATAYSYADALVAAPLVKALDSKIILTGGKTLEADVLQAIKDCGASKVVILGGVLAVSADVENALAEEFTVERLAGANRYETSALIAAKVVELTGNKDTAFAVSGKNFADALSICSVAAKLGAPVVYVNSNGKVEDSVSAFITNNNITGLTVIGGTVAVSADIDTWAENAGIAFNRIYGYSRYDTSLAINTTYANLYTDSKDMVIATGADYPDALVGGAYAAEINAPLLLVNNSNNVSDETLKFADKCIDTVIIIGGELAVSNDTVCNIFGNVKGLNF